MQIPINPPIVREYTADYYELGPITDRAADRIVTADVTTVLGPRSLVLWEGDAYTQIGDWTQEQAEDRIAELLTAQ